MPENISSAPSIISADNADIAKIADKMSSLNDRLVAASHAYYNEDREIMSNFEYDALYDELVTLEEVYGVLLPNSITQRVGADIESDGNGNADTASGLPKVQHETPMLSLDKTKSRDALAQWLKDKEGCLSWKLDGSTVVLTYENGHLAQAVTRGNGRIGEDITAQARKFSGVPVDIACKSKLVVRGEALMTYSEFERINSEIDDVESKYKNPRNLASGTMRALDESILDTRTIEFCPFTLVEGGHSEMSDAGFDANSYCERLDWLSTLGFTPVEHYEVDASDLLDTVSRLESSVENQDIPSDGLVLFFDDVAYGDSLGSTSHAPKNGIAFKWADETASTSLIGIAWQPSRTGRINPVAVFDPVELEGTTVERATLNNITFMKDMLGSYPYRGQKIEVYKANKIIPTIVSAEKGFPARGEETRLIFIPDKCPSCGNPAHRITEHDSEFLMCDNPECPAKSHGALVHFASRDALDIRGLSKKTIEAFMDAGVVASYIDILNIADKEKEIIGVIEGVGQKSFDNLVSAVESARHTTAARFLYSLGIREIGRTASADIASAFDNDVEKVIEEGANGNASAFSALNGIGDVMAYELCDYMEHNHNMVEALLNMVEITDAGQKEEIMDNDFIAGKTFVITGKTDIFDKRDDMKAYIAERGGKLAGSVSKNTDYLVTNTPDSGTAKNVKAQELGIPIITEAQFCEMAGYGE